MSNFRIFLATALLLGIGACAGSGVSPAGRVPAAAHMEGARARVEPLLANQYLRHTVKGERSAFEIFEAVILHKPVFQAYLREHKVNWWNDGLTRADKDELLAQYVAASLDRYGAGDHEREQSARVDEMIRGYGGTSDAGLEGYAALRALSKRNLESWKNHFAAEEGRIAIHPERSAEVDRLLGQVEFWFEHNSSRMPEVALISSRRLEQMGFSGGFHSGPFHARYTRSDDDVYFWFKLGRRNREKPQRPVGSQYGSSSTVVTDEFARKTGFVTLSNMYPNNVEDTFRFIRQFNPELVDRPVPRQEAEIDNSLWDPLTQSTTPDSWRGMLAEYHRFLLTYDDFTELVRLRLRAVMLRVKDEEFNRLGTEVLTRENTLGLSSLITRQSQGRLDLLSRAFRQAGLTMFPEIEGHIPVAVPARNWEPEQK